MTRRNQSLAPLSKSWFTRICAWLTAWFTSFFQKHSPRLNQEFGAVELVRWEKAPGSLVPGLDLLLVESTGHGSSYRRIAQLSLRKSPVPHEDDVGADMYRGTLLENNAYDEVVKAKWKKRTVTLV